MEISIIFKEEYLSLVLLYGTPTSVLYLGHTDNYIGMFDQSPTYQRKSIYMSVEKLQKVFSYGCALHLVHNNKIFRIDGTPEGGLYISEIIEALKSIGYKYV